MVLLKKKVGIPKIAVVLWFLILINYSLDYRYERVYSKFDNYNMALIGCDGLNNWRIFRFSFGLVSLIHSILLE